MVTFKNDGTADKILQKIINKVKEGVKMKKIRKNKLCHQIWWIRECSTKKKNVLETFRRYRTRGEKNKENIKK